MRQAALLGRTRECRTLDQLLDAVRGGESQALVLRGPGHYWFSFWTDEVARSVYITVAFALFLAVFASTYVVLRTVYGLPRHRVVGQLLLAAGAVVTVLGGLVTLIGAEDALTVWNDQLALLPWGLHRILGITVYLEIPTNLPAMVTAAGLVLVAAGGLSHVSKSRRNPTRSR